MKRKVTWFSDEGLIWDKTALSLYDLHLLLDVSQI